MLLMLCSLLTGCATNHYDCLDASADHIGEVIEIDIERQRILIDEFYSTYSFNLSKKWITVRDDTELQDSRGKEVSFHNLKLGDLVVAWNNGVIQDSYPSQTTAIKLRIVPYRFMNDCIFVEEGSDPPFFTGRVILHSLRRQNVKVWIHDGADILRSLPGQVMAVKVVVY